MTSYSLLQYLKDSDHPRSKNVARESIGDGHLYFSNPIFRSVRDGVLKLGFQITSDPSFDYFASPMLSLDRLLEKKELPCHRNLVPVKNLERSRPRHFAAAEVTRLTNKNYLLHESRHALAQHAWQTVFKNKGRTITKREDFILRSLFGEACANALDLTSWLYSWEPADKISLRMNSYIEPNSTELTALQEVTAALGARALLEFTVALYLFSNYSVAPQVGVTRKVFKLLFPKTKLTPPIFKNIRFLAKKAMALNPVFKTATTEVYFRSVGFDGKISDIVRASENDVLEKLERVLPALRLFSSIATNDSK